MTGTIVHSDRGSQYCSQKFQGRLAQLNMRPSMSLLGQRARRVDLDLAKARDTHWLEKVWATKQLSPPRSLDPCL